MRQYVPMKTEDPGSFCLEVNFANKQTAQGLLDLGASWSIMPFSIYKKIGTPKLNRSNAYLRMADKTRKKAMEELKDYLVRIGELIIPVDFLVLDVDQDDDEEPYLLLGRPFMDTTRMEIDMQIDMQNETIKMTACGKTLKAEITDDNSPTLYKARLFPYLYDEAEMDHAIDGIKAVRTHISRHGIRRSEEVREKARKPWEVVIPGYPFKNPKKEGSSKDDFFANFIQICSSNDDEAGCSKRKGKSLEETLTLGGEKRKKARLRNSEYGGKPSQNASPNDAEEETDQQGESPP